MIDFVEIRNAAREVIGIVDTAKSVIWSIDYYGVGDFELYIPLTPEIVDIIKIGNYVTRQNERNVGIIEHINITYTAQDGQMITATGSFAKSLLARRLIYKLSGATIYPVVSSGNVETAMRALVTSNIISATDSARNIAFLDLGAAAGLSKTIVDADGDAAQKQTSFANLQAYTDEVLQEYEYAAYVGLDRSTKKMQYIIYAGADRSAGNTAGNDPIVFAQDYDNLLTSIYDYDTTALKNTALIGGEGEGTARFMALLAGTETGINRREIFVDAADQSKTGENDQTYSDAVYGQMLKTKAMQALAELITVETMQGEIDITNSGLALGVDFYAGDIITVQDNLISKYSNARILKVTEVQDDNGYNISVDFGE